MNADRGHGHVQRHGRIGGDRHIEDAEQVEARQQAAEHGSSDIAAVKESQPRHTLRRRLHPAGDRGQGRAHQEGWRQQADRRDDAAHVQPGHTRARPGDIDAADERHPEKEQQTDDADAKLERGVDPQRMLLRGNQARQQQAAQAHPAHEGAEQNAHGDRRRSDDELQQLEPDDLVDQRGTAAADEQQQQQGHDRFLWRTGRERDRLCYIRLACRRL